MKKKLIARTLGIGMSRIAIKSMEELKEAITRQDIRELVKEGIIKIKQGKGKRKVKKIKRRRKGPGSIKKKMKKGKKWHAILTRKLRQHIKIQKKKGKMSNERYREMRVKIKARAFADLKHLREHIGGLK